MANATASIIAEEGPRNAVVRLTGVLDTSNVTLTPAITLANFTNNDKGLNFTAFRVDHVSYVISDQLEIQLQWNATTPQNIFALAGRGHIGNWDSGGLQPNQGAAGFDGSINLITTGWTAGTQNYTILIDLVKLYKV